MLFMRLDFTPVGGVSPDILLLCVNTLLVYVSMTEAMLKWIFVVMDLYLLNVMHMCAGLVPGYLCIVIH